MTKAGFCKTDWFLGVAVVISVVLFNRLSDLVPSLEGVAGALGYAHKQNIVHRDIKRASIMYEPESDSPKVTDFGGGGGGVAAVSGGGVELDISL